MSTSYRVAVVVGSLRRDAYSRKAANAVVAVAPESLQFRFADIGALPLYNQDLDGDAPPAAWQAFRDEVRAADAVLFVTPEYNRGVPGPLKNAVDVASRPGGKNAWSGKPAAVVSVTPGALGAFGANHALRQSLVAVNMPTMPQPEVYLARAGSLFDAQGALTDEGTREHLRKFGLAFARWIERNV